MSNRAALDGVNFLVANLRDGLGPFLAVYLLASQHRQASQIGIVMMIAGVAAVVARAPFGALVDWTDTKRGLIVGASAIVAVGAVVMSLFPTFTPVAIAQTAVGIEDAAFPPAIAAFSLGVVGTLSNSLAGFIVDAAGYDVAFLFLSMVALTALVLLWIAVPETRERNNPTRCEFEPKSWKIRAPILSGLGARAE